MPAVLGGYAALFTAEGWDGFAVIFTAEGAESRR